MGPKVYGGTADALNGALFDGMTIMCGGFSQSGVPEDLVAAVLVSGIKNLTLISNGCGRENVGLGALLASGQITKLIASFVGENKMVGQRSLSGGLDLELTPQGTLAERIRAGGAGIPAFYTRTGVGTLVADGKEVREFDGRPHLLEHWLKADLALVRAWRADAEGNLTYRKTARNFNPIMATAATVTVAQVAELVPVGGLDIESVHTPGIYVDRVVRVATKESNLRPAVAPGSRQFDAELT